jgi:phenylacetate-CoA ligase
MLASLARTFFHFRRMHAEQWLPPESFGPLQEERLRRILSSAAETPFYKNALAGRSINELSSEPALLPILEKDEVRTDPSLLIPPRLRKEELGFLRSSGSSGKPACYYYDREAQEYRNAIGLIIASDFGRGPADRFVEISRRGGRPFPFLNHIGIYRKLHIPISEDESMMYSILRKERPDILGWYPSIVTLMARFNQLEKNPLRLKYAYCSGEMLDLSARLFIEEAFSCRVFEQYSSVELTTIAWECPEEHKMHVHTGNNIMEIVDKKGKTKKTGIGRILITNLHNRAMPLLRYAIGDLGEWGKECACGRGTPVLKSLKGREDDFFVLPSGRIRSSFSFNLVNKGVPIRGIWEYQMVQENEDLIVFRYVPKDGGMPESDREELIRRLKSACHGEEVRIDVEQVHRIQRGSTGKLQKIVSKAWRRRKRSEGVWTGAR